ncbi:hypothetical protein [Gluconobacter wancherniae]|uniref:Uncharacterized protein n=1 Tax=Gluconobacter wancherniae NBRC 103581 TaxID=656744 RepID=A0A511AYT4_9PROT|nr:hypothetical protein [Gluconobacter wancherniae]GBD55719.1 hypothetical protein NBRC103581_00286 [Gluconobacter wancherniae NBRC 103581]GBR66256.1 hypothetical protein AA103581_2257 [Gluconobacter wancherniae NBRC 103581]GEK93374.1 hypothetical protein GWA01_11440 [Gluconobacter wancherniae NBRC 103581]
MMLQIPATFDRANVPAMAFLKVLPAEQRGVFHSLMDALKSARDVVFRVGGRALDDAQVAQMACEHVEVLRRVLPELEFTRFILRDEDGALYSPHLVERQIRREERAAARAEQQRRLEEFKVRQEAGEFAPEAGVKARTSRANASKGGRPRKGEKAEDAYVHREREAVEQREMRLLSSIDGGAISETENQNQFSKAVLVSGVSVSKPVSGFSVDLELEKDISPSDSTKPAETDKPALEISEALISQTVARVLKVGCLPDGQAGFAKSICGRFLRDGVPADVLVEAVKQHTEKMDVSCKLAGATAWTDLTASSGIRNGNNVLFDLNIKGVGSASGAVQFYINEALVSTADVDLSGFGGGLTTVGFGVVDDLYGENCSLNYGIVADYPTIGASITRLWPSKAGAHADWTGAGVSGLAASPPSGNGYSSTQAGQAMSFTSNGITLDESTHEIAGLRLTAYGSAMENAPQHLTGKITSASTDQLGAQKAMSIVNTGLVWAFDTDPATGKPWSAAALSALEFGLISGS